MMIDERTGAGMSRRAALGLSVFAAGLARPGLLRANSFPNRPIKLIVPYPPGGTTDIATRMVAEPLGRVLGQPVVVDNRPGANGIIGAGACASSPPDGHTLVMVLPAHAANATLQAGRMPYDPIRSFAPISLVVSLPIVLAGARNVPATTFPEYLDYVRARPGQVNYGSSGIGATAHLAMELLQIKTGVTMTHVPYRGTTPALQDLMAGNIGLLFDTYSTLGPQFRSGTIKPLGIATAQRTSFAPELPTMVENGVADFVVSSWGMLLAPAGTPQEIVNRLSTEVQRIVREPAMTARLLEIGFLAEARGPAETGAFLGIEVERWRDVIRTADVRVE